MENKDLFEKNTAAPNSPSDEKTKNTLENDPTDFFEEISAAQSFLDEAEDEHTDAFLKQKAAEASQTPDQENPALNVSEPAASTEAIDEHTNVSDEGIFDSEPEGIDYPVDPATEDTPKKSFKKPLIIAGCIIGALLLIYLGTAFYFKAHYLIGTTMNGIDVSGKTAAEVESMLQNSAASHTLTLNERGGKRETIDADQIHMQYVSDGTVEKHLQEQNSFAWPMALLPQNRPDLEATFSYDDAKLTEALNALQAVSGPEVTKAENAHPIFDGKTFTVKEEVLGNELEPETFKTKVKDAILSGEETLDLEAAGCYKAPRFHKDAPEVAAAAEQMNQYIKSVVTYTFGDQQEILDSATIAGWLGTDDNMQVSFNQELMTQYLNGLSEKYDTYGTTRTFTTTGGAVLEIGGGDYGWLIDIEGEIAALIPVIQAGKPATREPVYAQTAVSHTPGHDYGNTYIEISIGSQTMWFYKNGSLIVSTPIVTGSIAGGYGTPGGVYDLDYKATDVTLKGPGYASPVSFWMPYGGDIGIHDASWRSQFGGDIYLNGGSHGCVNTPYAAVSEIFYGIEAGDPVIVY